MNRKYKILHYVHYDNKFILNQINFLKKNFSEKVEQKFYVYGAPRRFYKGFSGDVSPFNIYAIPGFLLDAFSSDRIVLNGLFSRKNVALFTIFPYILKKAVWIPWGHDLYWRQAVPLSLKDKIYIEIQKFFMKNLYAIATQTPGDYNAAVGWYGGNTKYIEGACSLFEFDYKDLDLLIKNKDVDTRPTIQIGNSADPSNNHFELIEELSKFSAENIEIVAPLAYGDIQHANKVIEFGKKIFGSKFRPIISFQSPDSYNKHLSLINVLIFNHRRQQGFGNILIALYLGCKVFIDQQVATYKYLKDDLGCKIYDTSEIYLLKKEELFNNEKDAVNLNREIIRKFFNVEWQALSWEKVFFD